MFREPEWTKLFDTYCLADAPTYDDEVNMDTQKIYGTKDTSGTFSGVNPPISVPAPKPLSSNMDSRSVLPTKIPSFAFKCDYLTR